MHHKIILENESLVVTISTLGAELQSVINKSNQLEYLWQADPKVWARHSPVLFPIVGRLKNDTYTYNEKQYSMGQHGFARNKTFELISQSLTNARFLLKEDAETLTQYPFKFNLILSYTLTDSKLSLSYEVINTNQSEMYFSIGAHPGFRVPFFENENYEDYYLQFNETENAESHLIDGGLISDKTKLAFENPTQINLKKELFLQDALVFKKLKSNQITLRSINHENGLSLTANDFPFYGIWAQKNADFVCLEPWCGIADRLKGQSDLSLKEGINCLQASENFVRMFLLHFF